jgi:hypothetical protein
MRIAFSSMDSLSCPFFLSLQRTLDVGVTDVVVEATEPVLENLDGVETSLVGEG